MKLSELMKTKGYSFQDLADASGVAKATVARIVYGQAKEPHPSTKRKIAAVFGVEINDIEDFKESEEPPAPAQSSDLGEHSDQVS